MTDDARPIGDALRRASDGRPSRMSWRAALGPYSGPALVLLAVFSIVLIAEFARGIEPWGLSAAALAEGRWHTLGAHMFAHAGLNHLVLNAGGLMGLTPVVLARFGGNRVSAWGRYAVLFGLSGLAGAAVYLALQPTGSIPMVGASGAICGLWGASARMGEGDAMVAIRSASVWKEVKAFVQMNVVLFAILFVLVRMSGGQGGLAWEAHLGGFLFGLFAVPWFVRGVSGVAPERPSEFAT